MPIGPLGMMAAEAVTGQVLGSLNDARQLRQQEALQQLQIAGQKQMTDYNYDKQLQMWNATGYGAQVKQMKEANINPALLYGKGGGGGQTANVTSGNVSSGQAQQNPGEIQQQMALGLQLQSQLALQKAQKENIEADTRNKEADANKKNGVDTQVGLETASNIHKDSNLKIAQTANIEQETQKKIEEVKALEIQNKIQGTSANDQIKQIHAEAIGAVLKNALTQAQTANTKQQTEESKQKVKVLEQTINNMIQELQINWRKLDLEQKRTQIQNMVAEYGTDVGNNILSGALNSINSILHMR